MARFYTFAEVLTPEHLQWEVHARGLGCGREPGLVLQEVLDRNGGRYETSLPVADSIREQARMRAQVFYPREGHGLVERNHQLDLLRRTRAWFDRWLRDEASDGRGSPALRGARGGRPMAGQQ